MSELILEIGCEDLPSRFVEPTLEQLKSGFTERCASERLSWSGLRLFATPRRLALLVDEVAEQQKDLRETRLGPPAKVAFNDGSPTKAAEGFARGLGVDVSTLFIEETEKGPYVAAPLFEPGKPTEEVLPALLADLIQTLSFPKSMRWATNPASFARPIRWLLPLFNGKVLPVQLQGFGHLTPSNETQGHRFGSKGRSVRVPVSSIASYLTALEQHDVMLDQALRRSTIEELLTSCALPTGGHVVDDEGLLEEVVNLVEKPHGVLLTFDSSYLELPSEVLISSMRAHQRYFAIEKEGRLTNSCVIIYNTPVSDPTVVRDGNLRVLRARLDDARFFWQQDLRHPLSDFLPKLEKVTWIQGLGTMAARTHRISKLATSITTAWGRAADEVAAATRAGLLSKADLVTAMVFEFTDLQGRIGGEYAKRTGETEQVATAIAEQYLPRFQDDTLPSTPVSSAVALAEKLDALVGCFSIGLIPTSTADPYALRRAAIGVLKILQQRDDRVSLHDLLEAAYTPYTHDAEGGKLEKAIRPRQEVISDLTDFVRTRFEVLLAQEAPKAVVKAVLAPGMQGIATATQRVEALHLVSLEPGFAPLAAGFKRVVNILKKQEVTAEAKKEVTTDLFTDTAEIALHAAWKHADASMQQAVIKRDWRAACNLLIAMKEPIDDFFEEVMVMTDDLPTRENRLTLLAQIRDLFFVIGDLSEM